MKSRWLYAAVCIILAALVPAAQLLSPAAVYALSAEQKRLYDSGIHYYDIAPCGAAPAAAAPTAAGPPAGGGSLYMLGDSISVRSKSLLDSGFSSKNLNPYINASVSRSIKGAGTTAGFKTSGLAAVAGDATRIDNASTVVIALGTNTEADFEGAIHDLIVAIKAADTDKSGLQIFWVNVFSKGGTNGYAKIDAAGINASIDKLAGKEGFTVIDTTGKNIPLDDSVHPTIPEGTQIFADTVVAGVATGPAAAPAAAGPVTGSCSCSASTAAGTSGTSVPASASTQQRKQAIWDYFRAPPRSLTPAQVAGIMGNIAVESNFDPRALQPSTTGDFPVPNQGYGLVQWTDAGRQANLISEYNKAKAKDPTLKIYDLGFQLDHIWWELKGTESAAFSSLKAAAPNLTSRDGTTYVFSHDFERPAEPDNPARGTAATAILAEFGSSSPGASPVATTGPAAASCTPPSTAAPGGGGSGSIAGLAGVPRNELNQRLLSNPHWKPQSPNPTNDVKNDIAKDDLVRLMLAIVEQFKADIHPSVIKTGHDACSASGFTSNHFSGLAVDIGNAGVSQADMNKLFVWLYTNRADLNIDELIFSPVPAGGKTLDGGVPFVFDAGTMADHTDHIHVSVMGTKLSAGCPRD